MSSAGLVFGTAGVPLQSKKRDSASGIETVARLGLGAMELEFVHGVRIHDQMVEKVRQAATKHNIVLTCHGPYYINLNAKERQKREASIKRILDTARVAHRVGARSITFHAAFYLKEDPVRVHRVVRDGLLEILDTLHKEGIQVPICPETTGKPSQYGSLEEVLALSAEIPGVYPCIDFSHLHARSQGAQNSKKEFQKTLQRTVEVLGKDALQNLHIHISGIAYSAKGEQRHLELEQSDLDYRSLLGELKRAQVGGVVICESPNLEQDALLLQRTFQQLGRKGISS